jgi:hypothetical protein
VIYKPKRGKFMLMPTQNNALNLSAEEVRAFIDDAINGGTQSWLKVEAPLEFV